MAPSTGKSTSPIVYTFLSMTRGSRAGTNFLLDPGRANRLGRDIDCDIVLTDPLCSRVHAIIDRDEEGWWLRDQKSRNGCFINGQKVDDGRLVDLAGQAQLVEHRAVDGRPDAGRGPRVEAAPAGRAADAELRVGEHLPLAAGAEHVRDALEALAVVGPRAPALGTPRVRRQVRLEALPQVVGDQLPHATSVSDRSAYHAVAGGANEVLK